MQAFMTQYDEAQFHALKMCNVVFQATTVEKDFHETVSHVSTLNAYKLKRNSM